jgi:hypothetical protein
MARTICDYVTSWNPADDGEQILSENDKQKVWEFNLPGGTDNSKATVITFMVHSDDADDLTFQFSIGGHTKTYTIDSDVMRAFQEVVNPGALNTSDLTKNAVTFKWKSGDGKLRISNVVIWFQRSDQG